MRPLGGLFFGHLGDTLGRKYTLLITIFLMTGATVCMGLILIGTALTQFFGIPFAPAYYIMFTAVIALTAVISIRNNGLTQYKSNENLFETGSYRPV